jgi:AraC-like DNA-binding protein
MDISCISPYIRIAMDSTIPAKGQIAERVIFDYELVYVKEGEAIITIGQERYPGLPGDIFLFKPGQLHSIRVVGEHPLRQPHIHFDLFHQADSPKVKVSFKPMEQMTEEEMKLFRVDVTDSFLEQFPGKIGIRKVDYFEKMFFEIIHEFQRKLPFYETSVKGLFIELWTYLLREIHWSRHPVMYSTMEELFGIKDYLKHHGSRGVSLDELAREFRISKYHLIRLFKRAFGMTPIQYHQLLRIEKAKEMIQFTDTGFSEIADAFGYDSINAFSRAFRNVEGVPPSFYRRRGK